MKNNNIPEFILCSTPELARQVLEKIERESDLKWYDGEKPTQFIPNYGYPKLIIGVSGCLFACNKKGITNFTKAEDFLNNNYMTNKTWDNILLDDILINPEGKECQIQAIYGSLIFLSEPNEFDISGCYYTTKELIKDGYKIKGASEDKPSLESVIKLLEDAIWKNDIENGRAARNVREAIEMLKKLK